MQIKSNPRRRTRALGAFVCALAALSIAGCRREQVTHFRVEKGIEFPPAAAGAGAAAPTVPAGMQGDVTPPPSPASKVRWTLPKGWTEEVSGGMRYATLRAPVAGKLDVSVVVLPGPAGGELANVNRWRGQIGLPPLAEAELSSARKKVSAPAGELAVYDFTNDSGEKKGRMVAALAEIDGSTWFVKMTGDPDPVAKARPDFLKLLESLRRGTN